MFPSSPAKRALYVLAGAALLYLLFSPDLGVSFVSTWVGAEIGVSAIKYGARESKWPPALAGVVAIIASVVLPMLPGFVHFAVPSEVFRQETASELICPITSAILSIMWVAVSQAARNR